ncbi:hypothetical protein A1O3_05823 [Capronia epimyces CBS 606.96]|uniref:Mitochondrial ATPase inhibitor n=1 Tax=Capronia epimyces CBS 606.96 TaxID=1182542 RepID=W9XY21_9EURO|nr:uncharacterized protein A1O3_05823 [Capronia epimyces CBS 606.96]EXJ85148.1 hypothetical protein A1O3_05823 [Capronia epimyces CBS 606.96]
MLRTHVVKLARAAPSVQRSFSVAAIRASEGDTGGIRSGGIAAGLRKLKEKLAQQRKHLDELDQHIKDLESERSGEQ